MKAVMSEGVKAIAVALYQERGTFAFVYKLAKNFCEAIKTKGIISNTDFLTETKHLAEADVVNNLKSRIADAKTCIETLDYCRYKLHEELEIQSMKRFTLQLTYNELLKSISEEISYAVKQAKFQNNEEIRKMEESMKKLDANLKRTSQIVNSLEAENEIILVKRNELALNLDKKNLEWNKQYSLKYEIQIKIYETKEKIKALCNEIVKYQEEILKMKESLIEEHAAAIKEAKEISPSLHEIKVIADEWNLKNSLLLAELTGFKIELNSLLEKTARVKQQSEDLINKIIIQKINITDRSNYIESQQKITEVHANTRTAQATRIQKIEEKYEESLNAKKSSLINVKLRINQERYRASEQKKSIHQQRRIRRTYLSHSSISGEELKIKESELEDLKAQLERIRAKKVELLDLLNELEIRLRTLKEDCLKRVEELEDFINEYTERLALLEESVQSLEDKKRDLALELRLLHEHQEYFRKSLQAEADRRLQYYRENKLKARRIQQEALSMNALIDKLGEEIKMIKIEFKKTLKASEEQIKEQQAGVDQVEENKARITKVVLKRIPNFKRLQVKHYKVEKIYNTETKMFSYINQKEAIIDDEVRFATKNLESRKKKLAQWNARIESNRRAYIKALIVNANKIECIEETIYGELNKIRAIILNNCQLKEALEAKESICDFWQKRLDNVEEQVRQLREQENELKVNSAKRTEHRRTFGKHIRNNGFLRENLELYL
ncbi:uncharacterized protein LOC106873605 isoform X3 [Octopus bimaculoides]|uniref:uncharacterized protein LOC106873605 isoform X3 n=1 Tax=Octopus bimaculoides TaxID=37653 RepID=UPI0022E1E9F5|nr:uncharacterized protein LOC106873605 isoform X3 [Octopus bimaculoides]